MTALTQITNTETFAFSLQIEKTVEIVNSFVTNVRII